MTTLYGITWNLLGINWNFLAVGRLGVCLATSGPGGIHLLNGLYDAKLDGQPVLATMDIPTMT